MIMAKLWRYTHWPVRTLGFVRSKGAPVFRIDTRRARTSSHQGRVAEQRRPVRKSIRFCFATLYVSGVMYAKRAASASRVSVRSAPRREHAISAPRYSAEPCAYDLPAWRLPVNGGSDGTTGSNRPIPCRG